MNTLSRFGISRNDFRRWIKNADRNFRRDRPFSPVSSYVRDITGQNCSVRDNQLFVGSNQYELPDWAFKFVDRFESGLNPVKAANRV